ncbi:hypothetical protein FKG94_27245 [Exilibacterium tricleocarpae]|uniref:Uncharacterized protein n=1 Tax=Exilibacterium tricleocarpae TaxID=2591008 RepID=A0A545SMQ9_9GAMM|nr:hypothetical protein [Exilibacterium tricleocarpae]TQV66292.1 hypothetical protein FKG94_27245 [Exilibacterium tricleocarpae]
MQVSNVVVFTVVEVFLLLAAACVLLLVRARNLKQMTASLQQQVKQLTDDLRATDSAPQHPLPGSYRQTIDEQLSLTRHYHRGLNADQDIALDLNPETPLPRQIAALRHAFLIAEKEALHSSANTAPSWPVLETKLQQLIQFYTTAPNTGILKAGGGQEIERMATVMAMVKRFTAASEAMLQALVTLKQQTALQPDPKTPGGGSSADIAGTEKTQAQLRSLQQQQTDLEAAYVALCKRSCTSDKGL